MFNEKRSSMLHGVLLIALFSCAAFYIGEMSFVRSISFSPMIVGIILGMLYAIVCEITFRKRGCRESSFARRRFCVSVSFYMVSD